MSLTPFFPQATIWRSLLQIIKEFGKIEEYKINLQEPEAFLHANNKLRSDLGKQSHLQELQNK
jgi:hypothetical protein